MVGLTANRSIQDEKLIEAIFQSHHAPESKVSAAPVYGATATNLIIDARPTTNAVANTAKGAGTENMDHYREAKKAYLGIDNIHVVRDALGKVVDCLYQADLLSRAAGDVSVEGQNTPFLDRQALRRSGWLKLLSAIMEGTVLIVRNIHVNSSHVLIHCSDGWDRTAQLSALSQICLDPYYRTIRGFQVLIEKDWVSFGHRFRDRCGHLSSDKFFVAPTENTGNGGGAEAAQAFFASVQNRFASQGHLKEISPVFHQFLECVRQIQRQFPNRFEFNERFLRQMHTHLYSCQFGNFLYNCERERREPDASGRAPFQRTVSIWDFFNSAAELELNRNGDYDKSLDDPTSRVPKADMGVLIPNTKDIRFWNELYGRTDDEMNGRIPTLQDANVEVVIPVSGSTEDSSGQATPQEAALPEPAALTRETSTSEVVEDESWLSTGTIGRRASAQASTSRQPTPSKVGTQDLFGAGLKSVWGRLSTNASAAFTAVQGAYDGVARDFSNVSLNSESSNATSEGGGELRGRGDLASWSSPFSGEDQTSSSSAGTVNPWSTSTLARRLPSVLSDNPWGTERQPATPSRSHVSQPTSPDIPWGAESNALPIDPTVVDPASIRRAENRTEPNPWTIDTLRSSAAPTPAPASMQSSSEPSQDSSAVASKPASDPLGIGPL
jgi:myotubularin-related protein 6/7/8